MHYTGNCYRLDAPADKRHLYYCGYKGGFTVYLTNTAGEKRDFWEWVDGGTAYIDVWECLSSNLDVYPYACDIKLYWDPDTDADKVPDWRDECPNVYVETSDPDHSNGCPPTVEPSPTLEPTPAGCDLELYISPENVSAGEIAYLDLRAFRGTEPIAGDTAQVVVLDGPGTILQGALTTNEYGEAEFTYQAPANIPQQVTVQLMGTVAGCPDDAATAFLFLRPEAPPQIATQPPTPTLTPLPTPTQLPGELSIKRIVLLQAVEGGQLVGGRDVGVRVFLDWTGNQTATVEVKAIVDGLSQPPVRGVVKPSYNRSDCFFGRDAINLVVPWDQIPPASESPWLVLFPGYADAEHTLEITVRLISVGGTPVASPVILHTTQRFETKESSWLSVLFVSTDPSIDARRLNRFAGEAKRFLEQLYPISKVQRAPRGYQVSTRLGTMWFTAVAVEKARRQYNAERCLTPEGDRISPCNVPWARVAVGVFPDYHFGDCLEGFLYGRGGLPVKDLAVRLVSPFIYHTALVREDNPWTTAHEIGHHFGLRDEYNGSVGKPIPAGISTWRGGPTGFRTEDGRCVNIMGNVCTKDCDMCEVADCTWINAESWNTILRELRGETAWVPHQIAALGWLGPSGEEKPVKEIEGTALLVAGSVDQQGQARLYSVDYLRRYEEEPLLEGDWLLEALDATGNVLNRVQFGLLPFTGDDETPFLITLPVDDPAGVAQIRLSRGGQVLSSILRSPSAPTVAFEPLPAFGDAPVRVSWHAEDADGDTLRSTLLYSSDGGQVWQVLAVDLPETSLELNPAMLSGGEARFRVIVSDGLNEAEAVSDPVSLPNRPPFAYITSSWEHTFAADEPVVLNGYGYDLEDGELPPAQLQWLDAGNQPLSQGPQLDLTGLSPGEHRIIFQAQDSTGQTGRAEMTLAILPPGGEKGTPPSPGPSGSSGTSGTSQPLAGFEPLWSLLLLSICGLVLTIGGVFAMLFLARKHHLARWALGGLIPLTLLFAAASCLLGWATLSGGQGTPVVEEATPLIPLATGVIQPTATLAVPTPTPVSVTTPTPIPTAVTPVKTIAKPFLGPITFAEGITEDNKPINPATTFPQGITEVYALAEYRNMSPEVEFAYQWVVDGEVVIEDSGPWPEEEEGIYWDSIFMEKGGPLPPATYELRFYIGGEMVQKASFTVEAAP